MSPPLNSLPATDINQSILMQRIQDTLLPWQTSSRSAWKYMSKVPNLPIVQVDRQLFQELVPECWTSGDSVTTFLDIWHSREYTYNTGTAHSLRIANTYLYPAIQRTFQETKGTEAHRRRLIDSLIHFRYKARKNLDLTLGDFFTAYYFLAIPLHLMGAHWALAIIVNLNGVAAADWTPAQDQAIIFLLDSLSGPTAAEAIDHAGHAIRRWLRDALQVLMGHYRPENAFQIISVPETAQQPNGSDCGLAVALNRTAAWWRRSPAAFRLVSTPPSALAPNYYEVLFHKFELLRGGDHPLPAFAWCRLPPQYWKRIQTAPLMETIPCCLRLVSTPPTAPAPSHCEVSVYEFELLRGGDNYLPPFNRS
ncbi:hypothetical protein M407DRAFT_7288 [Tulasnella calospora MUT 4182]|uniref:Ubiquitin-like protease family profile domain-containing protein n=1 Tax=Tulasnella calospora MUT 4182 TaxID=1051891 RepID=A0A0C3QAQ7_9AGAM|nr:hypothetical protein M407DRAFT_7288 [Tulasnella calospora MUT 4182]